MSANDAQGQGGGGGSNFLSALGCDDCWPRSGIVARAVVIEGLLGVLLGAVGLFAWTACSPALVAWSPPYGLGVYRVFTSPFLSGRGLLNGLFSVLLLWQQVRRTEDNRGSVWLAFTILQLSVMTNLVVLLIGLVFGFGLGVPFFFMSYSVTAMGLWPAAFGLMALDAMEQPEEERQVLCFPCNVAAKWHPMILAGIFLLLSLPEPDLPLLIGLGLGYAMHYVRGLQLSISRASAWEASPKLAWFTGATGFRTGAVQGIGGGGGWAAAGFSRPHEPQGRFATIHGVSGGGSSSAAQQQQPQPSSVFSGQGHRLGSTAEAAPGSASAPAAQNMPPSQASAAAQAEARRQRAAAIDKRLSKNKSAGGSSTSSAPTASSPTVERQGRPASPSRATAATGSATVPLFTIGLDDEGDEQKSRGGRGRADDLEAQRLSASAAAASAAGSGGLADDDSAAGQGFVAGGGGSARGGKKGYSAVAAEDESSAADEADLEAAMAEAEADDDDTSERTRMHTQR